MVERSTVKLPPPNTTTSMQGQPDFLTLLKLDDAETQRRRISQNPGSSSTLDGPLGGLSPDFSNNNPFSDENGVVGQSEMNSAKSAPSRVIPFSDANAIVTSQDRNVYMPSTRQSRTQSISGTFTPPNISRAPSTVYRDSATSVESFSTRRNKFRSDPFDLEPLRKQGGSLSSFTARVAGSVDAVTGDVKKPAGAHVRTESFTGKHSSGVSRTSLRGWADPGPDVGPGARVGEGGEGKRVRRGSQGSVGRAM
jgi:hypothetical protein